MARSPVFAKMLSANMQESLKNSLNIEDFGEETVKGMLEWIYTGTTEIVSERAELLLQIAEKYELEGLKEDCEGYLVQKLCVENASNMLLLGHLYNAPYLKRRSTEFIIINKKEVGKTAGFKELSMKSIYTGVFLGLFLADHQSIISVLNIITDSMNV
ncbi:Speckle-type POZ protein [Orchesella cincta]|uniref:Speckle-type POZ protein n=1 Tax=Orchesella cincta TaxID=48709 RepID=A0A1D2M3B2_ORCCI|nr:Speckle-type POZ protein [Orchesella cincta]